MIFNFFITFRCYSSQGLCEGGCATQFEECENKKCSDLVEVTDWTPWLKSNETTIGGSWHEQRFRFSYKAPVALSQIGQVHMEERYCRGKQKMFALAVNLVIS